MRRASRVIWPAATDQREARKGKKEQLAKTVTLASKNIV